MKRGTMTLLGRKEHSLFDTNVKMRDMDNVELVLNSPTSPESGTASVRARPTVKHYTTSEAFQPFAVPTPRVPVLPTISGPKINGAVNGDQFSYGSNEEEISVPPPPSTAPPPPPETFILPPPDFLGYLSTLEMTALEPPPTVAPKPQRTEDKNRRIIKPPPMPPPKPPSTGSSGSASSTPISKPSPAKVPKHPNYAPPLPPDKGQQKTLKNPPPKPIRHSSMANLDSPPAIPAPPPPVKTPTQSTFNPRNTAKLNHVSNVSVLSGYGEQDTRPKQMLLFEDTESPKPVSPSVPVNGDVLREMPNKPVRKDPLHHKENLQSTRLSHTSVYEPQKSVSKDVLYHKENIQSIEPSLSHMPEVTTKTNTEKVLAQNGTVQPLRATYQIPRKLQTGNRTLLTAEDIQGKLGPKAAGKSSPLSDSFKNVESSEVQEAASPLSLLLAAQERDRYKGVQSREHSPLENQRRGSIQQDTNFPKPLTTIQRALSTSCLLPQDKMQISPTSVKPVEHCDTKSATISRMKNATSSKPVESLTTPAPSVDISSQHAVRKVSNINAVEDMEYTVVPLLPPPPEFDDFDDIMKSSPSTNPPDAPLNTALTPNMDSLPPAHIPPSPLPKASKQPAPSINVQAKSKFQTNSKRDPAMQSPTHIPPSPLYKAPKHPAPKVIQPNAQFQINSKTDPAQRPATLSSNKATLVSILQKKMLEMDHKITTTTEADYDSEDWGVPLSEEIKAPVIPKAMPQAKSVSTHHKQGGNVGKKYPDIDDNEPLSSHQYGMTYRVRPGSKKPITLVRKGLS
ncbi:proteoglycan 4 isoform X2 [Corythoichthys intestinalis]|uniref:proteoglycan 4 isoform X2 n=1 Tax=Corythoichthys intestinalis TaxID=161448 RepID=UPI0025A67EA0|nr:proteoglycan 4 isoform X2 [Corythoichthys intestinalis]